MNPELHVFCVPNMPAITIPHRRAATFRKHNVSLPHRNIPPAQRLTASP
ncbi:MAG: hypothetical protein IJR63_00390 [Synergistaceae bacterium]|nr:hypothetical protein [Synergistaceae bacterium]